MISILKIISGYTHSDTPQVDFNGDKKSGLAEAIVILQFLADLRTLPPTREYFLSGVIFADMTLDLESSPYTVTKNVRVLPGVTLTIEPGVEIKFEGNHKLWVDGRIDAIGTEADQITFTSAKSNPSPGNWQGIYFGEGATGNIIYSIIEYANRGIECYNASPVIRNNTIQNSYRSGIYLTNSSASVENNTIQNNAWAIALYKSSPPITGNTITNNENGISLNEDSYPVINYNSIHENSDGYDIKVNNYTDADTVVINASYNWWGVTALSVIEPNIFDYFDSAKSAHVHYDPILDGHGGNPIKAVVTIKEVSASPVFITPANGDKTTISYKLDEPAEVTVEIYEAYLEIDGKGSGDFRRDFFMTLVDSQSRPAGEHTEIWNGRDSNGNIADCSAFVYVIKTNSGNNRIDLYDPRYISGSVTISDTSVTPSLYNPYANEPVEVKYSLFSPAWVTIGGRTIPKFIIEAEPRNQGENMEIWDGRDGLGKIVDHELIIAAKAEILPENVIVSVKDTSLQITDVSTDAYVIIPSYGEISTVKYRLSKDASVSVAISDPNGNNWTLLESDNQGQGMHSIEWDGTNAEGKLVWPWADGPEGDYTVRITAVDSVTNTTVTKRANIHVYR